jgi:hypothetical protein
VETTLPELVDLVYSAAEDPARCVMVIERLARFVGGQAATLHHDHLVSHDSRQQFFGIVQHRSGRFARANWLGCLSPVRGNFSLTGNLLELYRKCSGQDGIG